MQINTLMVEQGPQVFYDNKFRAVLEDFMSFFKSHPTTYRISIEPIQAYKYEFDLFGLLTDCGISINLHWLVMRMNNMTSPTDATKNLLTLIIPNISTVSYIRQSHMSTNVIN